MKKLVALILVLGLATMANAAMTLSLSNTESLVESDTLDISISGDGDTPMGVFFLGIDTGGPGSLNVDNVSWHYIGDTTIVGWSDDSDTAAFLGVDNPFVNLEMGDFPAEGDPDPLTGLLVHGIIFHCDGVGDVTVSLYDGEGGFLDSVTIAQIPEPMTLALLGLGGLFIRRKK